MHLARARVAQHLHDLARRVAADDRVVHDDEPLAGHDLWQRVELHPQAVLAQLLAGLDERARDVAVLDEAVVLGQPALTRVPAGRGVAGVRHRDHEVRVDRRLACEERAHPAARDLQHLPAQPRVRPREVDVLEHAQRVALALDGHARLEPAGGQRDHLARLHVAQEAGADDVERAGLGGDAVAIAQHAERERPEAGGVAEGDDAVLRHDDRRVGALGPAHHVGDGVLDPIGLVRREQRGDDLGVRRRAERDAGGAQLGVQLDRVDEVAVVRERDLAAVGAPDGLGVLPRVGAGRRVADVADRHVAAQRAQLLLVEHLVDEALVAHRHDVAALGYGDACGLLAPVLQRVQGEVGETGDIRPRGLDTEHAALVARSVTEVEHGTPQDSDGIGGARASVRALRLAFPARTADDRAQSDHKRMEAPPCREQYGCC